jgi:hypothetical protein
MNHNEAAAPKAIFEEATLVSLIECLQERDERPGSVCSWKAEVAVGGEVMVAAIKPLPKLRLANELATAWLARQVGAKTPRTFLVQDPSCLWTDRTDEAEGRHLLATEFVPLPGLKAVTYESMLGFVGSAAFANIFLLDLAVVNIDRVDRNILYDGGRYCAIDHDKSLGGECWTSQFLLQLQHQTPGSYLETKLCLADGEVRGRIEELARHWQKAELDVPALAGLSRFLDPAETLAVKSLLLHRMKVLPDLVEQVLSRN